MREGLKVVAAGQVSATTENVLWNKKQDEKGEGNTETR